MIDWDAPELKPDFVRGEVVKISTLPEALALLDRWIEAYEELATERARTHHKLIQAIFSAECWETQARNWEALWEHRDKM